VSLLQRHLDYMARVRAHGAHILTYRPVCCGVETETTAPTDDDVVWDTPTICPHCGALYLKVVTRDAIITQIPPEK
jgi:hypothetical protein